MNRLVINGQAFRWSYLLLVQKIQIECSKEKSHLKRKSIINQLHLIRTVSLAFLEA